jgi:hypothetical protein
MSKFMLKFGNFGLLLFLWVSFHFRFMLSCVVFCSVCVCGVGAGWGWGFGCMCVVVGGGDVFVYGSIVASHGFFSLFQRHPSAQYV